MGTGGFREYLFDLLRPLGKIESRNFFGLDGIKADGSMLGFVLDEKLYLRTDEETRVAYKAEASEPFTFDKNGEVIVTSYYTVPVRLYDEPDELARWAGRALVAARKAPSAIRRAKKNAKVRAKPVTERNRSRT